MKKLVWQRRFGVFGVSRSALDNVYRFISDQKQHHQKQTFEMEFSKFKEIHDFEDVTIDKE